MGDRKKELKIRLALIGAVAFIQLATIVLLFFYGPHGLSMSPVLFSPLLVLIAVFPYKPKAKS